MSHISIYQQECQSRQAESSGLLQMLPFGGQGSNQAIEDGGALGFLFKGIERPGEISRRLGMFELVRRTRASRAQILSRVRVGKEQEIHHGLLKYADPPGSGMTAQPWGVASQNIADDHRRCS